jgi:gamma-glutamylcyclotransferase (GGCT)/AIG2-like uncharacterized protein YtfP
MTAGTGGRHHLAVYGSLRAGHALPDTPAALRPLLLDAGPCVIAGELFDLGSYPGLVAGEGRVVGELFELVDAARALALLDDYEGYRAADPEGSQYLRRRVVLLAPAIEAWVYVFNGTPDAAARIPSGDWALHRSTTKGQ